MINQTSYGEPRYIERCKSGSKRGLCKTIAEMRQGDTLLLYNDNAAIILSEGNNGMDLRAKYSQVGYIFVFDGFS